MAASMTQARLVLGSTFILERLKLAVANCFSEKFD